MRTLNYYTELIKKAIPFFKFFARQELWLLSKGRFKEAYNYFWAVAFTEEEGMALLDPLYSRWHWLAPYPGRIELEVTNRCSLRCAKCEHTYWKEKNKNMSYEKFLKIMNQFPKLKAISLSGIGHGFHNPDYMKMLRYCKKNKLFLQFFDPFLLIKPEISKKLVKLGVTKIWCSLDACTEKTYNKVQAGSHFPTVVKHLKAMYTLKKKYNSRFPEICYHFIVTKENTHEMADYIDFIYSLNPNKKDINLIQFTRLIPFKEIGHLKPTISKETLDEVFRRANKYGNFRITLCNLQKTKSHIKECTAWTVPFITVEGQYYPCCALTEANKRQLFRSPELNYGNLFETDFHKIWKSPKLRKLFRDMNKGRVPKLCKVLDCPLFECCPDKTKNYTIRKR